MINGLPQLDLPNESREPPCRTCCHQYMDADAVSRCSRSTFGERCLAMRAEGGACGPTAINFKRREAL
jgi:hypothetical protein